MRLADKARRWVELHAHEPVQFSVLTRALVTNDHVQRARSQQARTELRACLSVLAAEGVITLSEVRSGAGGPPATVFVLNEIGAGQ